MEYKTVLYEEKNEIGYLWINMPPANKMIPEFLQEIVLVIEQEVLKTKMSGIIVTGVGRHFSSGADVEKLEEWIIATTENPSENPVPKWYGRVKEVFEKLYKMKIPVVAVIRGLCIGSGLELALHCTYRIAEQNANMGLPETGFGLLPGINGTVRMIEEIGYEKALELIFKGELMTAEEALELSLVHQVVPKKTGILAAEDWIHTNNKSVKKRCIGIVGKGKMGMDLFQYFMDYECDLVLVSRKEEDALAFMDKTKKKLLRMKKRGSLSEDEFEKKLTSICVTTDFKKLKNCQFVIETVIEDLEIKKQIVKTIEENVSEDCIIGTNSSSLPLNKVFSECIHKERLLGIHFYYPTKFLEYVEINTWEPLHYDKKCLVEKWLHDFGKKTIELSGSGTYILSRLITFLSAYSFKIYREEQVSIEWLDQLVKDNILLFGPFETMDSTGLLIISQCLECYKEDRNQHLFESLLEEVKQALKLGYAGGKSEFGFITYEKQTQVWEGEKSIPQMEVQESCLERIKLAIKDEINYIMEKKIVTDDEFLMAVEAVLGIKVLEMN